jgi:hypothetical protein
VLKFHDKSCYTCKYYRGKSRISSCLNLGRDLSITGDPWHDRARYCDLWEERPKEWLIYVQKNPFWYDPYIPRETQLLLKGRKE